MTNKILITVVALSVYALPILGQADALHDALLETMRQSNQIRSQQQLQWLQLPERERYLRHHATQAAYFFRENYGRFPNNGDGQWIVDVERKIGVRNANEEAIFLRTLLAPYSDHVKNRDRDRAICSSMRQLGMEMYECD